jgi:2-dehydro-3-deoxyphosphogluconate aldolase/(4S)-4-hydroxy-2-oxoglutarate aldolase
MDATLEQIRQARIVAVIRAPSKECLLPLAEALLTGGVRCLEVTMSTPDALQGISELWREFGDQAILGIGTVLDPSLCDPAADAGAAFVVSPIFNSEIVQATKQAGLLSIPGAFTPTEIFRAWREGADVVKVFPSTSLGPSYFRDLLAPMPELRLMPTGGVDVGNAAKWFEAGAIAVGAGSSLIPLDVVNRSAWDELASCARHFCQACAASFHRQTENVS